MMTKQRPFTIIALVGEAGCGKSTVAKYLQRVYGFQRVAFATPLKEVVRRAFDLTHDQVYGDFKDKETVDPRYNVSPRWLLQRIGTEGMREVFGPDVWVNELFRQIFCGVDVEGANDGGGFVIDDLRFLNEARRIVQLPVWVPNQHVDPTRVHSAIFRLTGVVQGETTYKTHASEAEQSQIPAEWIRATVSAPRSPGGQVLLERFEEIAWRPFIEAHPHAQIEQVAPGVRP